MIPLIDPSIRIEFTCKADVSEPKTVFVFKPLTGREMLAFASDAENGQLKISGEKIFQFLELTIIEVKNMGNVTIKDILDRLPAVVIGELVEQAAKMNKMTGEDAKNY